MITSLLLVLKSFVQDNEKKTKAVVNDSPLSTLINCPTHSRLLIMFLSLRHRFPHFPLIPLVIFRIRTYRTWNAFEVFVSLLFLHVYHDDVDDDDSLGSFKSTILLLSCLVKSCVSNNNTRFKNLVMKVQGKCKNRTQSISRRLKQSVHFT